jgi:outer membrane protein OmpA-like peptidoglycan-associated protein
VARAAEPAPPPAVPVAPTPPAVSATAQELAAARQQNAELQARITALEHERQQLLAGRTPQPAGVTPPGGPTVISTAPGASDVISARLAGLEAEIRQLRATQRGATAPAPQPEPGAVVAAPADTSAAEILKRLDELRASVNELAEAPAAEVIPEGEPPAPTAEPERLLDLLLPLGKPWVFRDIEFETGSAELTPAAMRPIATLAELLKAAPAAHVEIVGHTDAVGRRAKNLQLSRERAEAVGEALIAHGVATDQVTMEGRGETLPIASNDTAEGRKANRRVEFIRTR